MQNNLFFFFICLLLSLKVEPSVKAAVNQDFLTNRNGEIAVAQVIHNYPIVLKVFC